MQIGLLNNAAYTNRNMYQAQATALVYLLAVKRLKCFNPFGIDSTSPTNFFNSNVMEIKK